MRLQRNSISIQGPLSRKPRKGLIDGIPCIFILPLIFSFLALLVGILLYIASSNNLSRARNKQLITHPIVPIPTTSTSTTSPLQTLKTAFEARYGATNSQTLLSRGITTYTDAAASINVTAHRMVRAVAHNRPFIMAFAGYSVTVGRGNFFHQSFPFVTLRLLEHIIKDNLGIPLLVRNAAIGGIPSFPYGFCFPHFLGNDADVISWDYSMNEGKDGSVIEAYIRQGLTSLPHRPMFIVLDTNEERCTVLKKYSDMGVLRDSISMAKLNDIVDKDILALPEEQRPPGFREWDQFGAPKKCPGRGAWHPKRMEHELMGWLIAMHMTEAVEIAVHIIKTNERWKEEDGKDESQEKLQFPPPINPVPQNDESITQLLFGHADKDNKYTLKDVSCRTSFLPAVDQQRILPSVIVSGLHHATLDMMQERTDAMYKEGWLLDVSDVERDTKKKVERCGGLGYIDMKVALYGIPESGPLRLWLPYEGSAHDRNAEHESMCFNSLILCEANEKRKEGACQLDKDMLVSVSGVEVDTISYIAGAGVYLNRKTCATVTIPPTATMTKLGDVKGADGKVLSLDDRVKLAGHDHDGEMIGLVVDIQVRAPVSRENGACCISHIIWEQH